MLMIMSMIPRLGAAGWLVHNKWTQQQQQQQQQVCEPKAVSCWFKVTKQQEFEPSK